MVKDRRKPLGGVEKQTYVDSGGHPLTYDLIAGLRSELCAAIKSVKDDTETFKQADVVSCAACREELSTKYIKKAFGKWPVSVVELFVYVLLIGIFIGSAIIDPRGLLEHFIKL